MLKIVLLLCSAAVTFAGPAANDSKGYKSYKNEFFSAIVPNWEVSENYDADMGIFGVSLTSPDSSLEEPTVLYVDYYEKGNDIYATVDEFIAGVSSNPFELKGVGATKPEKVRAGQKGVYAARSFETTSFKFVPPDDPDAKKITVREKYILIPDSKGSGFYVLRLYSGDSGYAKSLLLLNALSDSIICSK
ncbi:MAG: hypothetical protein WCS77_04405 [Elusimicrobiaceae bacterium]|jgi:hypothetical protein